MSKNLKGTAKDLLRNAYFALFPDKLRSYKEASEFAYWAERQRQEGNLTNAHYRFFFTTFFGLTDADFAGKRLLDIGCGPRGSLEWAEMAAERVGIDSLADKYTALRAKPHQMKYISSGAEAIPFPDGHFDIVSTFNSLDHVDSLDAVTGEIKRVCRPGGLFLLVVEVNHEPTPTEPVSIGWDITSRFRDAFDLLSERRYEIGDHDIYGQLRRDARFDDKNESDRPGIIACKFARR